MEDIGVEIVNLVFNGELETAVRMFGNNQIESKYDGGSRSYLDTHEAICKAAMIEFDKQIYLQSFEMVLKNEKRAEFFDDSQVTMKGKYQDVKVPELPLDWYLEAVDLVVKYVHQLKYPKYAIRDILNYLILKDTEQYVAYGRKFLNAYEYNENLAEAFYKKSYYQEAADMYLKKGKDLYNDNDIYRLFSSLEKINKSSKKEDLSSELVSSRDKHEDISLSNEEFEALQEEYDPDSWQYVISCYQDCYMDDLLAALYVENGELKHANKIISDWYNLRFKESTIIEINKCLEEESYDSHPRYPYLYDAYYVNIYYKLASENDLPIKSTLNENRSLLKSALRKHPPKYDRELGTTMTMQFHFDYILATNSYSEYDVMEYIEKKEKDNYSSTPEIINNHKLYYYISTEDIYNALEYFGDLVDKYGLDWLKIIGGYYVKYYAYFYLKQNDFEKAAEILNLFDYYGYKITASKLYFLESDEDKALEILEEIADTYRKTTQDLKKLIYMYFFHGFHDEARQLAEEHEYPELIESLFEHSGISENSDDLPDLELPNLPELDVPPPPRVDDLHPLPSLEEFIATGESEKDSFLTTEQACQKCGHGIDSDAKFCSHCGTALKPDCGSCGKTLNVGDKFCSECGEKV